jgi:membrane fusion protein (multidrug efflux system)
MKLVMKLCIATALVLSVTGLIACGQSDAKTSNGAPASEPPPLYVTIEAVQVSPFIDAVQATGIIKAYDDVMIAPEEGGVIEEWKVKKGDLVVKGQVLAALKDDVIMASYKAAEAQYKLAQLNFEKQEKVFEEQAVSALQLKSSEFARDAAKAQMELMKARLERTQLRSPITGVFNDRFVDEGEFAPPAMPAGHVVNISQVKVQADVPERHAQYVVPRTHAIITVDAFPNDTLVGTIGYVGAVLSANNRTVPIEIVIGNPERKLKPEMIARLRIIRSTRTSAVLINEGVIQQINSERMIVYIENGGTAEERQVKVGGRHGGKVEIVDGLKPGDRLIVKGFQKLTNGQKVQIGG